MAEPPVIPLLSESPAAIGALARATVCYTDLDGTLLGLGGCLLCDSEGAPATQTADAIARLNAAGLRVAVCSGRNRLQVAEISRLLGWRGFIAELGCVLVADRGADPVFLTGSWAPDALRDGETPYARIERAGAVDALRAAFPGRIEYHEPYHLNREATHVLRGQLDLTEAQRALDTLSIPTEIVDNGVIHPLRTGLVGVEEIHAYHIMPAGASKLAAVRHDMELKRLEPADVIAIGDSAADLGMAEVASLVVIVANALADERVREAAARFGNVAATRAMRGEGWAEFAAAWRAAKGL